MRFELFIATRYLRAKRRQAFIGIITGISIAGVAAGVASLIVALAINNGFRQDLQDRLIGSSSHISLLRIADDGIKDWSPLLDRLFVSQGGFSFSITQGKDVELTSFNSPKRTPLPQSACKFVVLRCFLKRSGS